MFNEHISSTVKSSWQQVLSLVDRGMSYWSAGGTEGKSVPLSVYAQLHV